MPKHALHRLTCLAMALWCTGVPAAFAQSSTNAEAADKEHPELAAADERIVPVRFRGRTLFEVAAPIGDLPVEERAAAIERRLLRIASGPPEVLEAIRVTERDGLSEIHAGEILIRSVSDVDALGTGRTRRQLAADYLVSIRTALEEEFEDRTTAALARAFGLAVAATVVLLLSFIVLRRFYGWMRTRLATAARDWREKGHFTRLRLLTPSSVVSTLRSVATALVWVIGIFLVYFYLEYVLSLFPWTRGIADTMVAASRNAVLRVASGIGGYLPSLLNIAVIVVVARFALKGVKLITDQVGSERISISGFYPEWAEPTYSLLRFLVIAVAAVMIFPYLPGSGSEGFKGVSVFIGLLVSLGAASAIANVIAGIVITYMRPFRIGDRVKIADAVGDITGKDLFVVRLRTIKNVDITIPNSLVLANHIINFSSSAESRGLILHTSVTIGYDVPWQKVHELLVAAARRIEGIAEEPAPFVLQTSLGDYSVTYELNTYTHEPNRMAALYSELHSQIQSTFNEAGVEILSPQYTAVRDGNRLTVPQEHLPKDYQAPSFNVLSRLLRPGQGS